MDGHLRTSGQGATATGKLATGGGRGVNHRKEPARIVTSHYVDVDGDH